MPPIPLPPQVPAPPPQPLPYIAAIIAPLDRLSPHERQNLLAARTQRELKAGQRCISTGGRAKQTLALLPVNASSPPKKKEQEILQLCQELKVPNIGVIEEPPVRPVTMTGQQAYVWMQKCGITYADGARHALSRIHLQQHRIFVLCVSEWEVISA